MDPVTPSGTPLLAPDQSAAPGRLRSGTRPYLVWDAVLAVVAVLTLVAFIVLSADRRAFWSGYGLQSTATLVGALALMVSIRLRAPNFAVPAIAAVASTGAIKLAGDEASSPVLIIVAAVLGTLVGLVLAVIVVGLRVPAWGASLVAAGLLALLTVQIFGTGGPELVRGGSTLVDLGLVMYVLAAIFATAGCGALFWMGRRSDMRLQAGALVVSSTLAAVAGMLLVLRAGFTDGRIGADLATPLAVLLLAGVSVRGVGAGVVGLVFATLIIETLSAWVVLLEWTEPIGHRMVIGLLGVVGLVAGRVLELLARRDEQPRERPELTT